MDCEPRIDRKLIEDLILCAETVCDVVRDTPCGCECCWIWQSWYNGVKGGNPTQEEIDEWECPMRVTVREIRKQMRG